ncbi:MAG: BolA family protein [Halocynthiibacter sp.]
MMVTDEIRTKLEAAFAPESLEVVNESNLHQGHAGDDGSGESHFRVAISATAFVGQTRIARHRAVHKALGPDLIGRIHALALDISAP